MRLSDAVLLGDSLKTANPDLWYDAERNCGCALAGAALAAGHDSKVWIVNRVAFEKYWPWLRGTTYCAQISICYSQVNRGEKTLEQLVDWIRSVEPEEAEAVRVESPRNEDEVFGQGTPQTELASANLKNKS